MDIFTPFPQLLTYEIFAPTIIRITVALALLLVVLRMHKSKAAILSTSLPILGTFKPWMLWISIIGTGLVGLALFFGYYTQIAAILAMLIALKHTVLSYRYPAAVPLSRTAYMILFFVSLSLLFSGAGGLAFDIHL